MKNLVRFAVIAALAATASGPSALAKPPASSGGVSAYDVSQSGVSVSQSGISIDQSGVSAEVDPQHGGAAVDVQAGNGRLTVEAGRGGAQVGVQPPGAGVTPAPTPSQQTSSPASSSPQRTGGAPAAAKPPAGPGGAVAAGPRRDIAAPTPGGGAGPGAASTGDDPAAASGGAARERSVKTDPAAGREDKRGVAPVLDFIEEIPDAVWAGLVALALIATAMWMLWVRGRRRLERNAWVDSETGAMNVVAFETLLAQEWTRSVRYQRPLGLLLLELEEITAGGVRRPLTGRRGEVARDAITGRAREADIVAQVSPTRVAVICPESSHGSVETLAHALERSLEMEQVHARVGMGERLEADRGP